MPVILLPRDAHGRVLDPVTGELIFHPVTGDQRPLTAETGPLSIIIPEPGEPGYEQGTLQWPST